MGRVGFALGRRACVLALLSMVVPFGGSREPVVADDLPTAVLSKVEASPADNEPPFNTFLANSHWPMSHRNPYNQGSSPFAGPTQSSEAQPSFVKGSPVPVTLAMAETYPTGEQVAWGVTTREVFKLDMSGGRIEYLASEQRPQGKEDAISGAYSLVDRDGTFYVPHGRTLHAYRDASPGVASSPIRLWKAYHLPRRFATVGQSSEQPVAKSGSASADKIVGVNLTYDGRLILLTEAGLVISLSRNLDDAVYLKLPARAPISNSFAIDETGGIFIVKSDAVVRVQWDPGLSAGDRLAIAWQTPYRSTDAQLKGRLGVGSGTTPSLVGTGDQDRFVVICDGQKLMHMVLIWRGDIPDDWQGLPGRDRRIAAEVPVRFGHADAQRSTTEQSLTVRGYDIVAVSNLYGPWPMGGRPYVKKFFGNDHMRIIYRSNYEQVAPNGVEKMTWNPRTRRLETAWANPEISLPNGIPSMSEATGLLYAIGQRESEWTFEAISWQTGQTVFHQRLGRSFRYNSFYAATEIGPGGSIVNGMYGGVMRFSPQGSGVTASNGNALSRPTTTQ